MEEKMRIMKNKEDHINLIKNLPKISLGQLMANGWLQMDKMVRDNKQKQKEQDDKIMKDRLDKQNKQNDNLQQHYQTAIRHLLWWTCML
jgi:hypothetical protein